MNATEIARELGRECGESAASWTFDGNTDESTYRAFLSLLEDGDPAIDQYGPGTGWLSGEYAEGPTPLELAHEVGLSTDPEDEGYSETAIDEACDAYEEAAESAYWSALEATAHRQI